MKSVSRAVVIKAVVGSSRGCRRKSSRFDRVKYVSRAGCSLVSGKGADEKVRSFVM